MKSSPFSLFTATLDGAAGRGRDGGQKQVCKSDICRHTAHALCNWKLTSGACLIGMNMFFHA